MKSLPLTLIIRKFVDFCNDFLRYRPAIAITLGMITIAVTLKTMDFLVRRSSVG